MIFDLSVGMHSFWLSYAVFGFPFSRTLPQGETFYGKIPGPVGAQGGGLRPLRGGLAEPSEPPPGVSWGAPPPEPSWGRVFAPGPPPSARPIFLDGSSSVLELLCQIGDLDLSSQLGKVFLLSRQVTRALWLI